MHNKKTFKKYLFILICAIVLGLLGFKILERFEYRNYRYVYDSKLSSLVEVLLEKYPEVDSEQIMDILNDKSDTTDNYLKKYGIDITSDNVLIAQKKLREKYTLLNALYSVGLALVIVFIFALYDWHNDKKVREITKLLEEINRRNYALNIDSNTEDELSILKSELSKVTIMLKEQAEKALKDKESLKNSLEDISHQLKTPLTSIMISLDNILDNPKMDEEKRNEFIHIIKRETSNVSFLVGTILKLTKFETNTINFSEDRVRVNDLLDESIKNVALLGDLKNVKVQITKEENFELVCDKRWQIEAITNILKNAIEHSESGDIVEIETSKNKIYSSIKIKNSGTISKKDLPFLFKRFYKGENASIDSVGIGLALSKSIIEKDGGNISGEVTDKNETIFTIKYFKRTE